MKVAVAGGAIVERAIALLEASRQRHRGLVRPHAPFSGKPWHASRLVRMRTHVASSDGSVAQLASEDAAYQAMRRDADSAAPSEKSADGYSGYLRDTQRVKDPYWGTSEQSTSQGRFHWTDGFGTYQHSDDPNQTSNVAWEQMEAE